MELRVLRYFLAVARTESFSAAAESLHITQPTLSRQIMELEDELGAKLLIRGKRNHKITLTEDGLLLRKRAEEIVTLSDKTTAEFHTKEDTISGDIYIGGGETDAMRLIAKAAKKLQQEHPAICFHLFSGNAEDLEDLLDKGLLDFCIVIGATDLKKYDFLPLPATDIWGLLMRKEDPLAQKKTITPQDLENLPLLVSRQALKHNELTGWNKQSIEKLHIAATYNLIYNAALMVDEGFGYALALDKLVNTTGDSTLCFRPLEPQLEAHLNVVWKKYQVFSKAAEKFLEQLQKQFS
ncbi:LysR family transcriptional regulator [Anaerotignum sp.]